MPTLLEKALPSSFSRRVPTQKDFEALMVARNESIQSVVTALLNGFLNIAEFGEQFYENLRDGHADAYTIGRQRAGALYAQNEDDFLLARGIADGQSEFLADFLEALESNPRYRLEDGTLNERLLRNRSELYTQRMRGTAGDAFVEACENDEQFNWVMAAIEDHCADCPELESISPWTKDTLFTKPGLGDTACRVNCKCHLVRVSDGRQSFEPVDL